jgi:hypothetical protein
VKNYINFKIAKLRESDKEVIVLTSQHLEFTSEYWEELLKSLENELGKYRSTLPRIVIACFDNDQGNSQLEENPISLA